MAYYNEVNHPTPCEWTQNCLLVFDMVYLLFTKASIAFKFGSSETGNSEIQGSTVVKVSQCSM